MNTAMKNIYIINHPLQIPKFHGHMKLELRGCRETEVVEHDNNMTNALEEIMDAYGIYMNPGRVLDGLCPTVENAFGGIVLTDKVLEDGMLTVPGGTNVIACGSYKVSNSDLAQTQGSYNTTESVLDLPSKKMTYVYDWSTNQGNGTIACASLTNKMAGLAGYGDAGLASANYNNYINMNVNYMNNVLYSPANTRVCMVTDDFEISTVLTNKNLTVYKYNSNVRKIFPFMEKNTSSNRIDYRNYEKKEIQTSNLNTCENTYTDGKYVYFMSTNVVYADEDFILYKLDAETLEMQEITLHNYIGERLHPAKGMEIYNNCIYLLNTDDNKLCEIQIDNPVDSNFYDMKDKNTKELNSVLNTCKGKIYIRTSYNILVFDCVTKESKYTKVNADSNRKVVNVSQTTPTYQYSNTVFRMPTLLYLATINNLDKEVTKTADKTMKVTYTIQEENL